jgi:23S rRNA (guanosine2251-2'-O)-methyltransferase
LSGKKSIFWAESLIYQCFYNPSLKAGVIKHNLLKDFSPEEVIGHQEFKIIPGMKKLKTSELNRISVADFQGAPKNPVVVVLDNIRSMNNIGSVFRTCDAFRVEKLLLCGITATPPHREIQKTALDATESVIWEYYEDTVAAVKILKKMGYNIFAVEQTDQSEFLHTIRINPNEKIVLIFGNEINGIAEEVLNICDLALEIPQFGTKHSLNVAVSAGIVLWDIVSKMRK